MLTLEEQERRAYIEGRTAEAALIGAVIDAEHKVHLFEMDAAEKLDQDWDDDARA